jgi:hypothetical protein
MNRAWLVNEIVMAICEVIRTKKECEITVQDLKHANKLLSENAVDHEDKIGLLTNFIEEVKVLPMDEQQKVVFCITKIYEDFLSFNEECIRILQMK